MPLPFRVSPSPQPIAAAIFLAAFAVFGTAACEENGGPARSTPNFEIIADPQSLPAPVARTRAAILSAARSGDLKALNRVLQTSELKPLLGPKPVKDPVAHWQALSIDGEGHALLAALIDVLEARGARLNPGADDETYVWPSFDALALDKLSPEQRVEFYRLADPAAVKAMIAAKTYSHYRVVIGKDGTWHAFSKRAPKSSD